MGRHNGVVMPKPGNKIRKPEDRLIAAILKVKPTADMPKYPKRQGKTAPLQKLGNAKKRKA